MADTFRSMVLDATLNACKQDKDAALEALGLGNAVRDRNHNRVLKRESELLQKYYAELAAVPRQQSLLGNGCEMQESPAHTNGASGINQKSCGSPEC